MSREELQRGFSTAFDIASDVGHKQDFFTWSASADEAKRFQASVSQAKESVATIFSSNYTLSRPFLVAMQADYDVFHDLGKASQDKKFSKPMVERTVGASQDLQIKADFLKANGKDLISVAVRTIKPGTDVEIKGLYIWYAPRYDDRESNWNRFGPISSPSSDDIPPGIWWIWAHDATGKMGKREPLSLSHSGGPSHFDVDAP